MLRDEKTGDFRPALTEKGRMEEIEDMLLQRKPYYQNASDFNIGTDDVPVSEITRRIIEKLNESNSNNFSI
jgi:shikimate kinase